LPEVPPVISPAATAYTSNGALGETVVVASSPANVPTAVTLEPQLAADATIRTAFVDASPTPLSCNVHATVSVQLVAVAWTPESWKAPTRKLYVVLCDQQS
jgi:hypothetical protein